MKELLIYFFFTKILSKMCKKVYDRHRNFPLVPSFPLQHKAKRQITCRKIISSRSFGIIIIKVGEPVTSERDPIITNFLRKLYIWTYSVHCLKSFSHWFFLRLSVIPNFPFHRWISLKGWDVFPVVSVDVEKSVFNRKLF